MRPRNDSRVRHSARGDIRQICLVSMGSFLLAAVSGFAATFIRLDGNSHSHFGAVHGKIGFLMVIFGTIHAVRHIRIHK